MSDELLSRVLQTIDFTKFLYTLKWCPYKEIKLLADAVSI